MSGSASVRSSWSYRPSRRHRADRSAAMLVASTQPQFSSFPAGSRPGRMFMYRRAWDERPQLPHTARSVVGIEQRAAVPRPTSDDDLQQTGRAGQARLGPGLLRSIASP